ncbi:hypothetical protein [Mycoplasmoides pneumoniae]|uniref:hypothetical protein n=2 Tax=Mycoplasmoides pneumoniae TaxID=2104 RepID=UPI0027DFD6D4|nr:hypothetical protein [Mycoplasmoides pneumoniae]
MLSERERESNLEDQPSNGITHTHTHTERERESNLETNFESFSKRVSGKDLFNLATNFFDKFPLVVKDKKFPGAISIYSSSGVKYAELKEIPNIKNKEQISKYKIIMPRITGSGVFGDYRPNIKIVEPTGVCTHSYVVAYLTTNKFEVENVFLYMKTKFFRFFVEIFKATINISSHNFKYVPIQDFSRPWNDRELYQKYNLTQEEWQYIENNISSYED